MAKRGRPFSEDPRVNQYKVRLNKKETGLLNDVRKTTGMSNPADIFRTALERMYEELREDD